MSERKTYVFTMLIEELGVLYMLYCLVQRFATGKSHDCEFVVECRLRGRRFSASVSDINDVLAFESAVTVVSTDRVPSKKSSAR